MFNIFRMGGFFGDGSENIEQITPEEALRKLSEDKGKNNVKIIDVREPQEFSGNLGHIENAKLIPMKLLPLKIKEMEACKDKEIIAVCHTGARSRSACAILKKHGFNNVYNLKGGMHLWKKYGFKTKI